MGITADLKNKAKQKKLELYDDIRVHVRKAEGGREVIRTKFCLIKKDEDDSKLKLDRDNRLVVLPIKIFDKLVTSYINHNAQFHNIGDMKYHIMKELEQADGPEALYNALIEQADKLENSVLLYSLYHQVAKELDPSSDPNDIQQPSKIES